MFGEDADPMHERGIVPSEPGLYFVGLNFLYSMTSDTITGVRRDAVRVANHIIAGARRRSNASDQVSSSASRPA